MKIGRGLVMEEMGRSRGKQIKVQRVSVRIPIDSYIYYCHNHTLITMLKNLVQSFHQAIVWS